MASKLLRTVALALVLLSPVCALAAKQIGFNRSGGAHLVMRGSGPTVRGTRITIPKNISKFQPGRLPVVRPSAGSRHAYHYSHQRHRWHGQWWPYAVGVCWAYDPSYDEYYWACGEDDDDDDDD